MALDSGNKIVNTNTGIVAEGKDIAGGYFSIDLLSNIPSYSNVKGAICFVTGTSANPINKFYQYNGTSWAETSISLPIGTQNAQGLAWNGSSWVLANNYAYREDVLPIFDYSFNGDITGKTTIDMGIPGYEFVKISDDYIDLVFTYDEEEEEYSANYIRSYYNIDDGDRTFNGKALDLYEELGIDRNIAWVDKGAACISTKHEIDFMGIATIPKGTYFMFIRESSTSPIIGYTSRIHNIKTLYQFDKEYIPLEFSANTPSTTAQVAKTVTFGGTEYKLAQEIENLVVKIDDAETGGIICDKTPLEIYTAYTAGKDIIGLYNDVSKLVFLGATYDETNGYVVMFNFFIVSGGTIFNTYVGIQRNDTSPIWYIQHARLGQRPDDAGTTNPYFLKTADGESSDWSEWSKLYFSDLNNVPKYNGSNMTKDTNIPLVKTSDWDGAVTGVATINSKIPAQATSENQLADKAFVNSTVQTATANFRGNWSTWPNVPTDDSKYPADYTGSRTPTLNDYMVVQDASAYEYTETTTTTTVNYTISRPANSYVFTLTYPDRSTSTVTHDNEGSTKYIGKNNEFILTSVGNTQHTLKCIYDVKYNNVSYPAGSVILTTGSYYGNFSANMTATATTTVTKQCVGTWRFKYTGVWATNGKSGWKNEYQINETPMTAAQLAAINSGITAAKVATYDGYAAQIAAKSTVTVSETGTSETKAKYITVDGSEYKVSGSSTIFVDWS